jgi:hypothetical protein
MYVQAAFAAWPLYIAAGRWATLAGGRLYAPPGLEWKREVSMNDDLGEWVRLGVIKNPGRAVRKVALCFQVTRAEIWTTPAFLRLSHVK